jgi:hypothetical protein
MIDASRSAPDTRAIVTDCAALCKSGGEGHLVLHNITWKSVRPGSGGRGESGPVQGSGCSKSIHLNGNSGFELELSVNCSTIERIVTGVCIFQYIFLTLRIRVIKM